MSKQNDLCANKDSDQTLIWATAWQYQQNDLCAQWRLRSDWASTRSDQSLLFAWRDLRSLATPCTAKTVISLGGCDPLHSKDSDQGGCPVWCESSLGLQVILWILSCGGSNWMSLLNVQQDQQNDLCSQRKLRSVKKPWVFRRRSSAQPRLIRLCGDTQANLSLRWVYKSFCWFCHVVAQMWC